MRRPTARTPPPERCSSPRVLVACASLGTRPPNHGPAESRCPDTIVMCIKFWRCSKSLSSGRHDRLPAVFFESRNHCPGTKNDRFVNGLKGSTRTGPAGRLSSPFEHRRSISCAIGNAHSIRRRGLNEEFGCSNPRAPPQAFPISTMAMKRMNGS